MKRKRHPLRGHVVVPRCRECGCTDDNCDGCVERTGAPCWWVEENLCSACFPDQLQAVQVLARSSALQIAQAQLLPGAIVLLLDRRGNLHAGSAIADHPIAIPLVKLAEITDEAINKLRGFAVDDGKLVQRAPELALVPEGSDDERDALHDQLAAANERIAELEVEVEVLRCGDLVAFTDGELDPDRAEAFRRHLGRCQPCAGTLPEAMALSSRLSTRDEGE